MLNRLSRGNYLRLLSGVYLAMFLVRVAFGILIITFGKYVASSNFVFGLVVSSAPLLELVTVVFAAVIVDRYGRKGTLLAGLALAAFSLYGLALIGREHYLSLALMNALHGVAAGLILVTTLALIASVAPPDKRGREMGLFNFANMFGWFAGFALGAFFLDVFDDLRYTFVIAGFLATLGLVYGQLTIREPARSANPGEVERHDFRALVRVLSNRRVLVLACAWLIVFLFIGSLITFFSRVTLGGDVHAGQLADGVGAEPAPAATGGSAAALGLMGLGALFMASQIVFGKLSDRYGRESMILLGAAGFVAFMITLLVGSDLDAGVAAGSSLGNAALLLFAVLTLAFAPAGLAALADEATRSSEGATMSVYSIVLNIGFIIGPPVVGGVRDVAGTRGMVVLFVVLSFVLLGLALVRIYQVRRARPPVPVPV